MHNACVVIAGGSGFLGSHMVELFAKQKIFVIVLQRIAKHLTEFDHFHDVKVLTYESFEDYILQRQHFVYGIVNCTVQYSGKEEEIHNTNVELPLKLLKWAQDYKSNYFVTFDTF